MAEIERRSVPGGSRPPALCCSQVFKTHPRHRVLDDVSLRIEPGESVALLGPNGAGKTSLLRVVLDFSRADRGSVEVFGVDSREPRARRALAFLPERFSPNPEMSGAEVLSLFARLRGQRLDDAERVRILERLEFPAEALARAVRGYSKGMLQKLGLAAVVLADAPMTVLDEPMSGLDPVARITMRDVLCDLRRDGRTLLFTTHALHDLELLSDRVLVLHGGRLVFDGPVTALRERYDAPDIESAFLACLRASAGVAA